MASSISVRGAREHNLKNVDIDIPRDSLTVLTGLSGSGKSSLAFDTIYAEGQRRYVESLSAYARQFLGQMEKPDVDLIEGLSPAISIDQKSASRNPRSTVGTITEVYDYLRLLFARIGHPHCPTCGRPIARQTPQEIVDRIMKMDQGTKFQVLAPVVRGRKGQYENLIKQLISQGFTRAYIDSELFELSEVDPMDLARYEQHTIKAVIDRLIIKPSIKRRLTDSLETALSLAEGIVEIEIIPNGEKDEQTLEENSNILTFSEHLACNHCGTSYDELAPRNFSFNSPYGACTKCDGLGTSFEVDPDLVISDEDLSISQGTIAPWGGFKGDYYLKVLSSVCEENNIDIDMPWKRIPKKSQKIILEGLGGNKINVTFKNRYGRSRSFNAKYEGIIPWLKRRHSESESDRAREVIEGYMREIACTKCKGARLNPVSLNVTIDKHNIFDVGNIPIQKCYDFFSSLVLSERENTIASEIIKEIVARLNFLNDVGLQYLSINRKASTLSGGEAQRIRLASQIGSGLVGVLYVLDEPSIGLHQRDNARLLKTMTRLRDIGNTVLVVEHDEETIMSADYVVDVGPGAGEHGGEIVHAGSVASLLKNKKSITGQYLSGKKQVVEKRDRRKGSGLSIDVFGAKENNLQNIDVSFPLSSFVTVAGVSGSGKSTLVNDIVLKSLMKKVYRSKDVPGKHKKITGFEHIDKVIAIDQSPIGRTPRSNPATYTGVFGKIRSLFAQTEEAKVRGYKDGRFSFNVKGGRCEACSGDGTIKIEMHFLPDVYVPCEICKGDRYNRDTLDVTYRGKNIADVLNMSIEEANEFFAKHPVIKRHLQTLVDVGLGYVRLGQSAPTLSGGEAQRVKLSSELAKRSTGKTLYVLDEPTTGLHFDDVKRLLAVLHRLVDGGNSVLVIEHNLDVVYSSDWVIELGPEGGDGGGMLIGTGTPEQIAKLKSSHTGMFLKELIKSRSK
ncbi:MAG: excinuclease ABC subunit UvrA [Acidimicrobiia bacterium]|nr:excinuclease ABC subunit UvrA [Acidimicrobiia bacterium]